MPQIIVLKPFKFAHRGVQIEEFDPHPEPRETTQEVVDHDGLESEGFIEIVGDAPAAPAAPTREELDSSLAVLPDGYTDPDFVVNGMRRHFGELFTDADEVKVRELVVAPAPAPAADEEAAAAPPEQPAPPAPAPAPAARKTTNKKAG